MRTKEEFDKVYQENPNPWFQDGTGDYERYNFDSRIRLADLIRDLDGDLIEIGCGLGYALDKIATYSPSKKCFGMDISEEAVVRARNLFPDFTFIQGDITKRFVQKDIIVLNECLWYILHDLEAALSNCHCKYLIINHAFLKEQKFDRDIIDGWKGLLSYLIKHDYTILHAEYDKDGKPFMNGLVLCSRESYGRKE